MSEPLLKARDVADLLGLEVGTVLDYFERGELPGFRIGGRVGRPVRFRLSEIEEWLESACRVNMSAHMTSAGATRSTRPPAGQRRVTSNAGTSLRPVHD